MTTRSSAVYEFYVHIDWIKKHLLNDELPVPKKLVYDMAREELDLNMSYQSFLTLSKKFLTPDGPSIAKSVKRIKKISQKKQKVIPVYKHDDNLEAQTKLFHAIKAVQSRFEAIDKDQLFKDISLDEELFKATLANFQNDKGNYYDLRDLSFTEWLERKYKSDSSEE